MAENDSRPTLACDNEELPATDPNQLAFSFAGTTVDVAAVRNSPQRHPPGKSRRELRSPTPGRSLLVPELERRPEEAQLEHGVAAHLPPGKLLQLRLTENRYTIISVQRGRECYRVRLHRMFVGAEPRLLRALARYVVHNDQRASALLSEYIEQHQHLIRRAPCHARRAPVRPRGRVHDLGAIMNRLNRRFFDGKLDLRITWGRARRRRAQRSIRVGGYSVEERLIRVHPVLDQEMVPRYFLEWVVFHEMLHGKHAIVQMGRRRCFHPPAFTHEEKAFPDYWRARLWEKANLDRLLG